MEEIKLMPQLADSKRAEQFKRLQEQPKTVITPEYIREQLQPVRQWFADKGIELMVGFFGLMVMPYLLIGLAELLIG